MEERGLCYLGALIVTLATTLVLDVNLRTANSTMPFLVQSGR